MSNDKRVLCKTLTLDLILRIFKIYSNLNIWLIDFKDEQVYQLEVCVSKPSEDGYRQCSTKSNLQYILS